MPECDFMNAPSDYRSDKMESREGRGMALERRRRWADGVPADMWEALGSGNSRASFERLVGADQAKAFWDEMAREAKELAELRGFWISWHLAGGFEALEGAGWNRATLFRKIRRFREVFGEHPDEYQFEWIKLDLRKAWTTQLDHMLNGPELDPSVR